MQNITDYIEYIPASNEPLSADVYFIHGEKYYYIFDVGNNDNSLNVINEYDKEKIVILSHYHADHTDNIDKVNYKELYVGDLTKDKINRGTVVEDRITLEDGIFIEIIGCTSPHVDGSLILVVNNEYTFIGDLYFTRKEFDSEKANSMLATLKDLSTKYFVVSHQEENCVFEKDYLIHELEEYFK